MNHIAHCFLSFGDEDLLLGNFIGDGQLAAPDRYQRAALTLRYDFALSRRWHVGAIYRGDWMRYDRPVPLRSAQQQVAVNVSLHF